MRRATSAMMLAFTAVSIDAHVHSSATGSASGDEGHDATEPR